MTLGLMAFFGRPMTMVSQILPPFILAVGVGFAVHLLAIAFQLIDKGKTPEVAIPAALRHSGPAILMSALTTAFGMASFMPSDLMPVRDVGVFVPLGIAIAAFLALALVPAVLTLVSVKPLGLVSIDRDSEEPPPTERVLIRFAQFGTRHPYSVVAATLAVLGVAAVAIPTIPPGYNILDWVPEDGPYATGTIFVNESLGGAGNMEIVVDTGRANGLYEPDSLRRIETLQRYLEANPAEEFRFQKTTSIADVVKEIHQALHENDRAYYATPDDRTLIAQELLLFENSGSNDLEKIVDSGFQTARLSVRSTWGSGAEYEPYLEWIEEDARQTFEDATVSVTGLVPILMTSLVETEAGMKRSYAVALLTITPLMIILIGSLRGGLSSMVPNLAPMIVVMGLMGAFDVPFDVFTIMTGSVAIGLAVDDTIHFLHGFYREFERTGDTRGSIARTLETTGEALLTTSLVLAIGFSVFLFATMPTLQTFGLITTLAILLAFLADILVAPALVTVATRHRTKAD